MTTNGTYNYYSKQAIEKRIQGIKTAIKGIKQNLKDVLKKNAQNGEEWNNERCIVAHEGSIRSLNKNLKDEQSKL